MLSSALVSPAPPTPTPSSTGACFSSPLPFADDAPADDDGDDAPCARPSKFSSSITNWHPRNPSVSCSDTDSDAPIDDEIAAANDGGTA